MPRFVRMRLRGDKVWARLGPDGNPAVDEQGRVEIRYRLDDSRAYRAAARNLEPIADAEVVEAEPVEAPAAAPPTAASGAPRRQGPPASGPGETASSARRPGPPRHRPSARPASTARSIERPGANTDPAPPILIYTDGACTGNPGPMGIGVVLLAGEHRREISEYLGVGTNNVAELTAILRGLEAVKDRDRRVVVHSDSSYAIGLLSHGWKAKANRELVERIRALASTFRDLRFAKVEGHAGVPENERCDELARDAIARAR